MVQLLSFKPYSNPSDTVRSLYLDRKELRYQLSSSEGALADLICYSDNFSAQFSSDLICYSALLQLVSICFSLDLRTRLNRQKHNSMFCLYQNSYLICYTDPTHVYPIISLTSECRME
ncbi:ABC transporter G family member 32-like [Dorcoceras hygrometricum]|uniref:ABC transporter G family member 32-like n=1 Tax=Dorcoceras hygrometricum TaxID=472368 RepID=A0A2Z7CGG2_9LAMI|nr:ABC transporter G family member 32-like [Dorcoceras hygrometricum]